jgi:ferric-dicitrate binding protein FerR (iron transport regulator)
VLVEPTLAPIPIRWLGSAGPKRQSTHIIAGQQTLVDGSGVESTERLTDTSVVTGWQTGHLAFESEQLRYVLDAVNRYAPKPIVVEDESVANLRITGTVSSRNVGGWIVSLESALPLRAVETPSRIVLQRVEVAGSPAGGGQTGR